MMAEEKALINRRVCARWDDLRREDLHGVYETLMKIVHEERAKAHDEAVGEFNQQRSRGFGSL